MDGIGLSPRRILLADDNEDHLYLLRRVLDKKFEVDVAHSGREVLQKLEEGGYDLVLLDYGLPDMSGLEVLHEIHSGNDGVPVIMITGQGSEDVAVKALTTGALDYIVKSESFHEGLIGCIERNLEKYELQQEVRKTKEYLQRLVESAPMCIITTDLEGRIVGFNRHAEEVYGYRAEEVLGKHASILQPEETRDGVSREIFDAILSGKSWEGELLNKRKNGEVFPIYLRAREISDENGRPMEMLSLGFDISEKKRLEEQLREHSQELERLVEERTRELMESERRYRDLFESTQDAVYRSDENSVFVSMNQAGAEMFGFSSPSEMIGRSVLEFWVDPEDRDAFLKELEKKGSLKGYLIRARKRNGEVFYLEASSRILRDEEGNFKGVEGILRDITERKRREAALKEYSEILEEKVEERTRELVESNRLKDLFTDIMRHDLLNPIGVIRNYAELMLEVEDDEAKRKDLRLIIKTAKKLISMIENASKYEMLTNTEDLVFEEKDLTKLFQEVITQCMSEAEKKGIKVEFLPRNPLTARVHYTMEDVFANLLSNAIKYSPPNTAITIDIDDRGGSYLISVADQGEGVPDRYKTVIFERFKRGGKKGVKGTGLGLAIVKRVMDVHKGKVWVEDNPGGGSIFYVELPKG
jgi:PAS domain S-box-containing protein